MQRSHFDLAALCLRCVSVVYCALPLLARSCTGQELLPLLHRLFAAVCVVHNPGPRPRGGALPAAVAELRMLEHECVPGRLRVLRP